MGRMALIALGLLLVAACAGGCSAPSPLTAAPLATLVPLATPNLQLGPATSDPPTPTAPIIQTVPTVVLNTQDSSAAERSAIAALARELGISEDEIQVISIFPQEWSDASLGCPQPGMVYPHVITAGYLITLGVGDEHYNVHTDLSGTAIVCYQGGSQSGGGPVDDPLVAQFIEAAKALLAEQLGIAVETIAVVRSEAVDWSDASLGCAEAGQSYAQVISPGYRIILAVEEDRYEFHTDQERMFLCQNPSE